MTKPTDDELREIVELYDAWWVDKDRASIICAMARELLELRAKLDHCWRCGVKGDPTTLDYFCDRCKR